MAQTKILKRRIRAAKNISQITKAMQMVAAAKMKKAQDKALKNRVYASKLFEITRNLFEEKEFKDENRLELYVVITPNKGLCGSLITNIARKVIEVLKEKNNRAFFICIGKKGQHILTKYGAQMLGFFDFGIAPPKYAQIVAVARQVLDEFNTGHYASVSVLYADFINTLVQRPRIKQILPIKKSDIEEIVSDEAVDYVFEPSRTSLLKYLIPYYVENQLFQLALEAYASEQSARMMAMKNATDNATEVTKELTLIYNRARQMQITNEINDIATAQLAI